MRTYYSPEERAAYNAQKEAEADARIQTLAESWDTRPEDVAEYLRFRQQFHQYSSRNLMLMYVQNPNATYVGSFSRFQELGYAISRGEHGMSIQAPIIKEYYRTSPTGAWRPLNKDTPPEDRRMARVAAYETQQRIIGYRTTTVFDITQTTCPIEDYPKLLGMGYNSEQHAAIYREMCAISAQVGFPVTETQLPVELRGQCGVREIRINQILGDTQKLDTLFHELGHGLLGHLRDSSLSMARKEFEADAFSILMSYRYGVEVTDARKNHLAAHYKNYCQEIRDAGGEVDITAIMAPVNRQYTMLEERLEKRLDVVFGREVAPVQEELPPLEDRVVSVSHIGAAFEAEEMTQERLTAIYQRELSPFFENFNFRDLKMPASVGGRFRNCTFSDCDFSNSEVHATFDHCSIYDAETNNATFQSTTFQHCTIAQTKFDRAHLNEVFSAETSYLHCSFVRTKLDGMIFEGGLMDNVYFHHDVEVRNVSGVDTLQMTMGGATSKEVENHIRQIKEALTFGTLPTFDMTPEVRSNPEIDLEEPVLTINFPPPTHEAQVLHKILYALKIEDVTLDYDDAGLVATDGDNTWRGEDFYRFLADEAFVFREDGSVLGINEDLLAEFKMLSEQNGVTVGIDERQYEWDTSSVKFEHHDFSDEDDLRIGMVHNLTGVTLHIVPDDPKFPDDPPAPSITIPPHGYVNLLHYDEHYMLRNQILNGKFKVFATVRPSETQCQRLAEEYRTEAAELLKTAVPGIDQKMSDACSTFAADRALEKLGFPTDPAMKSALADLCKTMSPSEAELWLRRSYNCGDYLAARHNSDSLVLQNQELKTEASFSPDLSEPMSPEP